MRNIIWYKRKDKTFVAKYGRYKLLEILKRPHGGFYCGVYHLGSAVAFEGYHGTSLLKKYHAVRWGMKKARELKIIK